MTRPEVIALMASLKAKPQERRLAERLWRAGTPRKRIADILGVSEHTVKHWRYQDQWPARSGNHRECREPEMEAASVERPVCWVCAGRSATWDGHPSCRGRAA